MAQTNAIRKTHGFRLRVSDTKRQDSDLLVGILPRSLATSGEEGGGCNPGRASLGSPQPAAQPVELAGEQGAGESENGAGILGHARIQTTLDLYVGEGLEEMIAAQEKFLDAVGFEPRSVQ